VLGAKAQRSIGAGVDGLDFEGGVALVVLDVFGKDFIEALVKDFYWHGDGEVFHHLLLHIFHGVDGHELHVYAVGDVGVFLQLDFHKDYGVLDQRVILVAEVGFREPHVVHSDAGFATYDMCGMSETDE